MIVSFTQTYGDRRSELHDIHLRDTRLIEFKKFFDVNIYSFHNVPFQVKDSFLKRLHQERIGIASYCGSHYASTIRGLKKMLKEIKATHILWTQDDTFSDDNEDIDWKELIDYVTFHRRNFFLSLRYSPDDFTSDLVPDMQFGTFGIHHLNAQYWMEHGLWAMDDEPFICTIDMFNELYNEERLAKMDVWSMESMGKNTRYSKIYNRQIVVSELQHSWNEYSR